MFLAPRVNCTSISAPHIFTGRDYCTNYHHSPEHEPEYFQAVAHLDDHKLAAFGPDNFVAVRVAVSAYGIHLFGKIRIPALDDSGPAYIHFRAFVPGGEPPRLHSIHTEGQEHSNGDKTYRAIFTKDDALEWFDT
ncbi:hypothetical protein CSPAE12_05682 [Colletotrichum incanum]|nr:hypothetical protein CSPAE12_05682 [Colletotrichum incanum]